MRSSSRPVSVATLVIGLVTSAALAVTPKDHRFVSGKEGIAVEAPPGWTLSTHTGYPNVLVLMLHPDGSRISIAASETPAKDARQLFEMNRKGLEAQKLTVLKVSAGPRDGVEIEGHAAARNETLIQLYLVRPIKRDARQAIVISLIARSDVAPSHRTAMDFVVSKLALEPIELAQPSPPAKTGSGGEHPTEKERR